MLLLWRFIESTALCTISILWQDAESLIERTFSKPFRSEIKGSTPQFYSVYHVNKPEKEAINQFNLDLLDNMTELKPPPVTPGDSLTMAEDDLG